MESVCLTPRLDHRSMSHIAENVETKKKKESMKKLMEDRKMTIVELSSASGISWSACKRGISGGTAGNVNEGVPGIVCPMKG